MLPPPYSHVLLNIREGLFCTLNVVYHFSKRQVPNALSCLQKIPPPVCVCFRFVNTLSVCAWKNVTRYGCMNEGTKHELK